MISETAEERALFHALRTVKEVVPLAQTADVSFVGVGHMGNDAPLVKDGFVTTAQMTELQGRGAIGEVVGGVFDRQATCPRPDLWRCEMKLGE